MAKPGRTRPWVLSVALVTLMQVVALPVVLGGSPAAHAATASPGAITLHVQSARSVGAGVGYIHRGDAVTSYKWLIAAEDVGNPDDSRANCLPQTTLVSIGHRDSLGQFHAKRLRWEVGGAEPRLAAI